MRIPEISMYQGIGLEPEDAVVEEQRGEERQQLVEEVVTGWEHDKGRGDRLYSRSKSSLDMASMKENDRYVRALALNFLGRLNTVDLDADKRGRLNDLLNEKLEENLIHEAA